MPWSAGTPGHCSTIRDPRCQGALLEGRVATSRAAGDLMTQGLPRPMCFVAMPAGRRSDPRDPELVVDFDRVFGVLEAMFEKAGYQTVRVDLEKPAGAVPRSLREQLFVAELV